MAKTIVVAMNYEKADSIRIQGKRNEIQKYLNKGYYEKENQNGNWVLVKSGKIKVTLSNGEITATFNMREDVMNHYGRIRLDLPLFEKFKKDVEANKILLTLNSEESYTFY